LRGSILGVGTDVAGSLRIPAVCNNIYAFKPSSGRLPYGGQVLAVRAGTPGIVPSVGFMSHSPRDLWFLSRNVLLKEPWDRDAAAYAVPWRDVKPKEQLIIGVISEDIAVPVSPQILDAIKEVCQKLRSEGTHIVKEIEDFPSLADSTALAWEYFMADESGYPLATIKAGGEPPIPSISAVALPSRGLGRSLNRLYDMNVERAELKDQWRRLFVEKEGIDVLLLPAARHTAVPHDTWKSADYTVVWNLVDVRHPSPKLVFLVNAYL
jgi:amidase